jgi:23S rRNA-/tRNA-specific pseudouridylate synthase
MHRSFLSCSATVSIAHRDDKLLVLVKPSGIPTTSPDGRECLVHFAQRLDAKAPLLHPFSRLDAEVSGLVTFARTRTAIQQLLSARESGQYHRLYLALSSRAPQPIQGVWQTSIAIDPRDRRRRVAVKNKGNGSDRSKRSAVTRYQTGEQLDNAAILFLRPQTGRTHQLRVHASAASAPILGDRHYGGPKRLVLSDGRVLRIKRVMLHCLQLVVPDLVNGGAVTLSAEPPVDMRNLWSGLGGSEAAFDPSNEIGR